MIVYRKIRIKFIKGTGIYKYSTWEGWWLFGIIPLVLRKLG